MDNCEMEQQKISELYKAFQEEKREFDIYKKEMQTHFEFEEKRIENDRHLFEQKLKILQNAYQQLDIDRKAIEQEKRNYHMNKEYKADSSVIQYVSIHSFFKGVNSLLALKKRYKDLIKIFHPDNLCGDKDTVQMINQQYCILKEKFKNE